MKEYDMTNDDEFNDGFVESTAKHTKLLMWLESKLKNFPEDDSCLYSLGYNDCMNDLLEALDMGYTYDD